MIFTHFTHLTPTATTISIMKTLDAIREIYRISPWEVTPQNILEAFHTAIDIELQSKYNKEIIKGFYDLHFCKLKKTGKKKRKQVKITFGTASFHNPSQPAEIAESEKLSDKLNREITSTPIIEKFLYPLFTIGGALRFSTKWVDSVAGTHDSLMDQLMTTQISLETLTQDIKNIIARFEKNKIFIIGYKSSYKMRPTYPEQVLKTNPITFMKEWVKTGKTFTLLPKFRLYLIKIIKDREFAAQTIQLAWKKYHA